MMTGSVSSALNFCVPAKAPQAWFPDNPGPDHVRVDVHHASDQVFISLNSRGMTTILPKGPRTVLPLIVLLTCPACNQLDRFGYGISILVVAHQQVNVIGRDHVVRNGQSKSLLRLQQPCIPALPVARELEKKFSLVASVRDVPHISRDIVAIGSRHLRVARLYAHFQGQNSRSKPENEGCFRHSSLPS